MLKLIIVLIMCYCRYKLNELIVFNHFTVLFNLEKKVPIEVVQTKWTRSSGNRPPFRNDYRAIKSEYYSNSGYTRGHLVPFADGGGETMTMLNIVPQLANHNQDTWNKIEKEWRAKYFGLNVKTYVKYNFSVWINTPDGKMYIPYEFCKVYGGDVACVGHV